MRHWVRHRLMRDCFENISELQNIEPENAELRSKKGVRIGKLILIGIAVPLVLIPIGLFT
jgi:hypothetical protein